MELTSTSPQEAHVIISSAVSAIPIATADNTQSIVLADRSSEMQDAKLILSKKRESRSFDDLLFLKNYLMSTITCWRKLLDQFDPYQLEEFCRSLNYEEAEVGTSVYNQGDEANKLYVIIEGTCIIRVRVPIDSGGGTKILSTFTAGQYFGERALEYKEPRGNTVTVVEKCSLITITPAAYNAVVKQVAHLDISSEESDNSKKSILKILSKSRQQRSRGELSSIVSSVGKKLDFMKKFSYDEQIELFRVCDFVTCWGKTTIFEEGAVGQAFYMVIKGSVDVFVKQKDSQGNISEVQVGEVRQGKSFGEKALEGETEFRNATCITCESLTELLVISKLEYKNFINTINHPNFKDKVSLLRKTHCFQSVDLSLLTEIASLMTPKTWRVNSLINVAGELCSSLAILKTGEFGVKSEIRISDGSTKILDFGRVGPGAVIGEYCLLSELLGDEVICKETVTATTNCNGYVITKADCFSRLSREQFLSIADVIRHIEAPKSDIWDLVPRQIDESGWKIQSAWELYRKDVRKQLRLTANFNPPDLVTKYRRVNGKFSVPSKNTNHLLITTEPRVMKSNLTFGNESIHSVSTEEPADEITSMSKGMPSPHTRRPVSPDQVEDEGSVSVKFRTTVIKPFNSEKGRVSALATSKSSSALNTASLSRPGTATRTNSPNQVKGSKTNSRVNSPQEPSKRPVISRGESDRKSSPPPEDGKRHVALLSGMQVQHSLLNSRRNEMGCGLGTVKPISATNIFRPPFALIQLHRERLKMRPLLGSRRALKCYFRICAMVGTCNEAKIAAEAQLYNLAIRLMDPKLASDTALSSDNELNLTWSRFNGFSTMPLQNTDHFLIYCRGAPVEFASFSPPIGSDLLDRPFPNVCKATGQTFACISTYRIAAPRPNGILAKDEIPVVLATINPDRDAQEPQQSLSVREQDAVVKPLFLKEMSCVAEVLGTSSTRLDCLRYAFALVEHNDAISKEFHKKHRWTSASDETLSKAVSTSASIVTSQRLVVTPMYVWMHISEDTFQYYDHSVFSLEDISEESKFSNVIRNHLLPRQDMIVAKSELDGIADNKSSKDQNGNSKLKSVSDELKDAIAAVGNILNEGAEELNSKAESRRANNYELNEVNNAMSAKILKKEKNTRALYSGATAKLKTINPDDSIFSLTQDMPTKSRGRTAGASTLGNTKSVDSIDFRLQSINASASGRQKVIDLNNELCVIERKLAAYHRKVAKPIESHKIALDDGSVISYDPDGKLARDAKPLEIFHPEELNDLHKKLAGKRVEILSALNVLPYSRANFDIDNPSRPGTKDGGKFNRTKVHGAESSKPLARAATAVPSSKKPHLFTDKNDRGLLSGDLILEKLNRLEKN